MYSLNGAYNDGSTYRSVTTIEIPMMKLHCISHFAILTVKKSLNLIKIEMQIDLKYS